MNNKNYVQKLVALCTVHVLGKVSQKTLGFGAKAIEGQGRFWSIEKHA